ncbi:MAG: hypothetical protein JJT89_18075 [Nitriliruptoraceae bacterium]|nr:hypothetical protein [Nitriliruptoraceae bacterium]
MDELLITVALLGTATFVTGLILPITTRRSQRGDGSSTQPDVAVEVALEEYLAARR